MAKKQKKIQKVIKKPLKKKAKKNCEEVNVASLNENPTPPVTPPGTGNPK